MKCKITHNSFSNHNFDTIIDDFRYSMRQKAVGNYYYNGMEDHNASAAYHKSEES